MTNLESNFSAWISTFSILVILFLSIVILSFGEVSLSSIFLSDFSASLFASLWCAPRGAIFLCLVIVISLSVFCWSRFYMGSEFKLLLFYFFLLGFVGSMLVLISSGSIFSLFLGWEGLGVTSFMLILFYQNWASMKGSLLTLLTNRLGDAIFMASLCYWLSVGSFSLYLGASGFLILFLSIISFTKSAQWPFISWLPAAMAAPTPVSALVHSSTLVTAGIWLILRMGQASIFNFKSWFFFGFATLLVASTAALLETDAKKVVALSTLSQLGLMFVAFSLGNFSMSLFHVLVHALAKSNLFLVVGSVLHSRFAQQDSRSLSDLSNLILMLSATISVLGLVGMLFVSSFFSKEQILMGHYKTISGFTSWILLLVVSSMTLSYCLKLILLMSDLSMFSSLWMNHSSKSKDLPMIFLGSSTVVSGFFLFSNFSKMICPISSSISGLYWALLVLAVSLNTLLQGSVFKLLYEGFLLQLMAINSQKRSFSSSKLYLVLVESSFLENFYLLASLNFSAAFNSFVKVMIPLSIILILIFSF